MNIKCKKCDLVNYEYAEICVRCGSELKFAKSPEDSKNNLLRIILKRAAIFFVVCLAAIVGFYVSLVFPTKSISSDQARTVSDAIALLKQKGFRDEVFLLRNLAAYKSEDNWLNASVPKENAYAATNFPFEIVTLYSEFFTYPMDDIERAAILLHEAKHLQGKEEKAAYEFVWSNRAKLGWTSDTYGKSEVWQNVRKQTREYVPNLFICEFNDYGDCTQ